MLLLLFNLMARFATSIAVTDRIHTEVLVSPGIHTWVAASDRPAMTIEVEVTGV